MKTDEIRNKQVQPSRTSRLSWRSTRLCPRQENITGKREKNARKNFKKMDRR